VAGLVGLGFLILKVVRGANAIGVLDGRRVAVDGVRVGLGCVVVAVVVLENDERDDIEWERSDIAVLDQAWTRIVLVFIRSVVS
jgi:hypothetical protein